MKAIQPKTRILEAHDTTWFETFLAFMIFNALFSFTTFLFLSENLSIFLTFPAFTITLVLAIWNNKINRTHQKWTLDLLKVFQEESYKVLLENRTAKTHERFIFHIALKNNIHIQAPPGALEKSWNENLSGYFPDVIQHMKKRPPKPFFFNNNLSFSIVQKIKPMSAHKKLSILKKAIS